jgi:hypothetical protein
MVAIGSVSMVRTGMQHPGAGVAGRLRAGQLAASDPVRALAVARAIPDAWYRCQALTSIARAAPDKYVAQALRQARAAAAEAPDEYQRTAVLAGTIAAAHARGERALAQQILQEALDRVPAVEPANSRAYALHAIWAAVVSIDEQMRRHVIDCALAHCDPNRGWRTERLYRDMVDMLAWDRPDRARTLIDAMLPGKAKDRIARRRARGERRSPR